MSLEKINEGTTGYLTVNFKDKNDALEAPTSATYRIDCLTNGQEIKTDTPITPIASCVEIELTATDNTLVDQSNLVEKRLVTVSAVYGADDKLNDDYEYQILNLRKKS